MRPDALFQVWNPYRDGKIRLNLTAEFDRIAKIPP